jgi:hypothetical protein
MQEPDKTDKKQEKNPNLGRSSRLDAPLLDAIRQAAGNTITQKEIYDGLDIPCGTWYRWLQEAEEPDARPELRELREILRVQRKELAGQLLSAAVASAKGLKRIVKDPLTGKPVGIYDQPPDGRLAAQLATRLAPDVLPPEKQQLKVEGVSAGPTFIIQKADVRDIRRSASLVESLDDLKPKEPTT